MSDSNYKNSHSNGDESEECINYLKALNGHHNRIDRAKEIKCLMCSGNPKCPDYMTDSMKPDIVYIDEPRILNELSGISGIDHGLLGINGSGHVDCRSIEEAVNEGEELFDFSGEYIGEKEIYGGNESIW